MMDLRNTPVREVYGVGPKKEKELAAFGIQTVADLLEYYPFRYEDYRLRDLTEVKDGEKATVEGTVYGTAVLQRYGRNKSRLSCKLLVNDLLITAVWFNRHFLKDRLVPGQVVTVSGKWDARRLQITVAQSEFKGSGSRLSGTLQPVYSVGGEITQTWMRKTIRQALQQFGEHVEEVLPESLIHRHKLVPRKQAIQWLHAPSETGDGVQARRRMVYEELFLFQLKLQAYRAMSRNKADGVAHAVDREAVRAFVRSLPFRLTKAQKYVIADILNDLEQPYTMNRLLQGDVGSGKTVVAAVALYAAVTAGYQGALMAPTEILAEQHHRSLQQFFTPYGVEVGLLTGSMTERQRRDVLSSLQMGLTKIIVGTHALIQEGVYFANLGLVITDEQHRFGVQQRSVLRQKGVAPDVLTMTATPIPRTLAITAFGDMDVSVLDELPAGRMPIKTYWIKPDQLEQALAFIEKQLKQGRQAYFICPLIEESEKLDVQNAIDLHLQLQQYFQGYQVGLLHGRMTAAEKDEVMRGFKDNEVHVLVSTTVVEVGVDVPNATVMVIYDADRFGLSQLHQLRGRVGRGSFASTCILIANPKSETGMERMRVMTETNDGFEIARRDLELRGPGDFFGTKQSGLPEFRIADLTRDFAVLEQARNDAAHLVKQSEFWTSATYLPLREYVNRTLLEQGEVLD